MKSYKIPLFLVLASFGVRLLYYRLFYYCLDDTIIGQDAANYVKLARRLASGDLAGGLDAYWAPLTAFLIALPSIFTDSRLLPIFTVSIIAGSFAAVAAYYLVKQSYGRREASIAAAIAVFYPLLLQSTFNLGTENIYLPVMIFSIIAFWKGLTENRAGSFFLAGLLLGLGYLTRPEAFGYLLFFGLWLVLSGAFSGQKTFSRSLLRNVSLLLLGFALLAAPYVFYLRSATGVWTVSAKFGLHVVAANPSDRELDAAVKEALESPHYIRESGKVFAQAAYFIFRKIHKTLVPNLFPPFLLVFVGIGLFRARWTGGRFRREIYLLSFCAATIVCYALNVVEVRYFYILLPVLFGWVARGIVEMEDWLRESIRDLPISKLFPSGLPVFSILLVILVNIYTLPLNSAVCSPEEAWKSSPFEQRAAGLWIKENAKPAPLIMTADFRPAFYAEGEHIPLPSNNPDEVLAEAAAKRVDFLVIDERSMKGATDLSSLLNEPQNYPKLELVYQAAPQTGYKIVIYRLKTDAAR